MSWKKELIEVLAAEKINKYDRYSKRNKRFPVVKIIVPSLKDFNVCMSV